MDGGKFGRGDRLGGRPRLCHPDGPAFDRRRNRPQAPPLSRQTRCGRIFRSRPRHPGGAIGGPADSAGKAAAVARAGAEWILNSYLGAQHRPVMQTNFTPAGVDPVRRYVDEVVLHGTPDAVADQIAALRDEIALDYLLCAPLSHESFLLLTDKVLPRLA